MDTDKKSAAGFLLISGAFERRGEDRLRRSKVDLRSSVCIGVHLCFITPGRHLRASGVKVEVPDPTHVSSGFVGHGQRKRQGMYTSYIS